MQHTPILCILHYKGYYILYSLNGAKQNVQLPFN